LGGLRDLEVAALPPVIKILMMAVVVAMAVPLDLEGVEEPVGVARMVFPKYTV